MRKKYRRHLIRNDFAGYVKWLLARPKFWIKKATTGRAPF